MATPLLKMRKFRDIAEMEFFLQGGYIGADISRGIVGLVGLTLHITAPALNITFVSASRAGDALLLTDIKTQIETAQPLLKITSFGGKIGIIEATPIDGLSFPSTSEAAKTLLGMPKAAAFSTFVYSATGGASPSLVWIENTVDNAYLVATVE